MAVSTRSPARAAGYKPEEIHYPWYEEETVVQGDWHGLTVVEAMNMVSGLLRERPGARAFSDTFLYWEEGNPRKRHAPDLFVFPEVDRPERERKSVRLWQEVSRPVFALEVLSEGTTHEDFGRKYDDYQNEIRIPEYFLCDPAPRPMRLWGYRLSQGVYTAIELDEQGRLWSEGLRAWLGTDDSGMLRIWDAEGRPMPRYQDALRLAEEARRQAEEQAHRAEEQAHRAEEERRLREAAEIRLREVEEELRRLKRRP